MAAKSRAAGNVLTIARGMVAAAAIAGTLLSGMPASAQAPSRARLLEAERRAKMQRVEPPQRSPGEKGLIAFSQFSRFVSAFQGGWKGFHFDGGDFPAGAGFAYGVGFTSLALGAVQVDPELPNRIDVSVTAASSTSAYRQLSGDAQFRNIGAIPLNVALRAKYFEHPQEDFFGLGAESAKDDRTSYFLGGSEYAAVVWLEPVRWLRIGGGAAYLSPSTGAGEDPRFPSLEETFDPAEVPGFETQPNFLRFDVGITVDRRDQPMFPRAGGLLAFRASNYEDRDFESFDFRRYEIEAQYYIPWLNKYRVLALRANAVLSDVDAGREVPFYYMPTLGGGEELRGFREFRFRDRNSLLLTAEYRWEAWWPLEMALFVDAGKVVADRDNIDFHDLQVGYGIGFRLHSHDAVVFRLDLANSSEGFIPLFRYQHVF